MQLNVDDETFPEFVEEDSNWMVFTKFYKWTFMKLVYRISRFQKPGMTNDLTFSDSKKPGRHGTSPSIDVFFFPGWAGVSEGVSTLMLPKVVCGR